ncbi:hypothetical protein [Patulibacter minatonensis]|uniref:hypothetical protein n=1 Tax=Patulibacter minatonensis TaxID=298163 RepID=UPI000478749E|nr:hypothetical protein [Patulibacter minatonensis]
MAKTRKPPVEEPKRRGRLFWICLLVLLEAAVWTILSVAGVSEGIATVVALVGGFAFVVVFNEKIWGEGWRDQLKADRAKRPR